MKKFLYIFFTINLIIVLTNCNTIPELNQENLHNYNTSGFLDQHHLQIVLKVNPAKKTKGLVNQRENAIIKARASYKEKILNLLATYLLDKKFVVNNNNPVQKIPAKIQLKLKKLIDKGKIIAEYYAEDNSAVIVFRIKEYKLKNSFKLYEQEISQ